MEILPEKILENAGSGSLCWRGVSLGIAEPPDRLS
jgi:hypothetical protein